MFFLRFRYGKKRTLSELRFIGGKTRNRATFSFSPTDERRLRNIVHWFPFRTRRQLFFSFSNRNWLEIWKLEISMGSVVCPRLFLFSSCEPKVPIKTTTKERLCKKTSRLKRRKPPARDEMLRGCKNYTCNVLCFNWFSPIHIQLTKSFPHLALP